ncbi:hypothetical protein COCNU_07G005580 [Cocos nucifera]|uniref:Uncharacterized protein n=1 Tax=Cocos nucifera TaxID=13894 RepID=A0A8K0IEP3_COCNU|nr:hypothetical protein COCNU_07G005580 [Cocos nucifera]
MKKGREQKKKTADRKTRRKEAERWHGTAGTALLVTFLAILLARKTCLLVFEAVAAVVAVPASSARWQPFRKLRRSGRRGFEGRQQAKRVGTWRQGPSGSAGERGTAKWGFGLESFALL